MAYSGQNHAKCIHSYTELVDDGTTRLGKWALCGNTFVTYTRLNIENEQSSNRTAKMTLPFLSYVFRTIMNIFVPDG